jgi:hypothetical protein
MANIPKMKVIIIGGVAGGGMMSNSNAFILEK